MERLLEAHGARLVTANRAEGGARVVVSVDCGITATGPADVARDAGRELIITAQHNLPGDGDPMPDCVALVHPRLPGGAYPCGELCGAGVAYKLAWRRATMDNGSEKVADGVRTLLLDLLSLAALGTVADVVPLVDETRVIVRFGLSRCTPTEITGLTALIDEAGLARATALATSVQILGLTAVAAFTGERIALTGWLAASFVCLSILLTSASSSSNPPSGNAPERSREGASDLSHHEFPKSNRRRLK